MPAFGNIGAWLSSLANHSDPNVVAAASTLSGALEQAASAVPAIAADAVNLALEKVPGGALVEGMADQVVIELVGELLGQHSNPPAALAAVSAKIGS